MPPRPDELDDDLRQRLQLLYSRGAQRSELHAELKAGGYSTMGQRMAIIGALHSAPPAAVSDANGQILQVSTSSSTTVEEFAVNEVAAAAKDDLATSASPEVASATSSEEVVVGGDSTAADAAQVLRTPNGVAPGTTGPTLGDGSALDPSFARAAGSTGDEDAPAGIGAAAAAGKVEAGRLTGSAGAPGSPRVAVIAHTGYFAGDSYGGAVRASLALLRELKRLYGEAVDIVALTQRPMPEGLVFRIGDGGVGLYRWEGHPVLIATAEVLRQIVGSRRYHLVVSLSIEAKLLRFALSLSGCVYVAMAHNYYLPPFGPFRGAEAQPDHEQLLCSLDLVLSPCHHHTEYLRRWCPREDLTAAPLFAAAYRYFHQPDGQGKLQLPPPMRPWDPAHRFVTIVSPCPAKGLSVLLALARRMPSVAFAAVPTQWTDEQTRKKLAQVANISLLEPNADVDVIFRQTKVLLAPSLWQECCPLVVMEALLRGIPCVSSDVFGLPEANLNPRLVVRTSLCFDHARGMLLHGVTNAQLERRLGELPSLPTAVERAAAFALSVEEEANADEAGPFEELIRQLTDAEAALRRESAACRQLAVAFSREEEGRLDSLVRSLVAGTESSGVVPESLERLCSQRGLPLVRISANDLGRQHPGEVAKLPGVRTLDVPERYMVVHKPYVIFRAAPSTAAKVLGVLPCGTIFSVDADRGGWVSTLVPASIAAASPDTGIRGWVLVDGRSLGLEALLKKLT